MGKPEQMKMNRVSKTKALSKYQHTGALPSFSSLQEVREFFSGEPDQPEKNDPKTLQWGWPNKQLN